MAWGLVRAGDGKGFNLILVEQSGEIYGEWMMLINKMGLPANVEDRPEPFPFGLDELEEEIRHIDAMHIYSTQVKTLDIGYVKAFIADYF